MALALRVLIAAASIGAAAYVSFRYGRRFEREARAAEELASFERFMAAVEADGQSPRSGLQEVVIVDAEGPRLASWQGRGLTTYRRGDA